MSVAIYSSLYSARALCIACYWDAWSAWRRAGTIRRLDFRAPCMPHQCTCRAWVQGTQRPRRSVRGGLDVFKQTVPEISGLPLPPPESFPAARARTVWQHFHDRGYPHTMGSLAFGAQYCKDLFSELRASQGPLPSRHGPSSYIRHGPFRVTSGPYSCQSCHRQTRLEGNHQCSSQRLRSGSGHPCILH